MSLYDLWIYEKGRAERVTSARYEHTLRIMWRNHRDAAITMDGELLEHRPGTEPMALRAIEAAAREAAQATYEADEDYHHEPVVTDLDPEDLAPVDLGPDLEAELQLHADALAQGPELVGPGPLQEASPSLQEASPAQATPVTPPCAARGCTGTIPQGSAPAETADLCPGHRSQARAAMTRLGCPLLDAARAIRVYGHANRSTVNLSRLAA